MFITFIGMTLADTTDAASSKPKTSETTRIMNKFIYAVYPILIVILLWGSKPFGIKKWNDEAFSLRQMKSIQGFLTICIMLHHIGQRTCASWFPPEKIIAPGLEFFSIFGYCFVSVFFFCSGYGLYVSFHNKQNYLNGFFRKRVFIIILSYYTSGLVFLILRFIMRQPMDVNLVLYYIIGVKMSNPHAWYVVVLPLLYLFFYLSFRFCKKDGKAISCFFILVILFVIFGTCIDHNNWLMCGEWWYNTVLIFPIGVLFAKYQQKVLGHFKKHNILYYLYLILMLGGIVASYYLSVYILSIFTYYGDTNNFDYKIPRRWVCVIAQLLVITTFTFFIFMVSMKLRVGNRFLAFMGTITLEFYLIHGIFLEPYFETLTTPLYEIRNVPLLILIVFIPAVPAALLLKKLHNWIMSFVNPKKTNKNNENESKTKKNNEDASQNLVTKELSKKDSNDNCVVEMALDDSFDSENQNTKENEN